MALLENRRHMVGERLAELREHKALTLHDLEELSGVGADGISKIENGHRKPRPSTLRKLAAALGVEVEDFFKEPILAGKAEGPREAGPSHNEAVSEKAIEEYNQRRYGSSSIAQGWDRLAERWTQRLKKGDFDRRDLELLVETLEDVAMGMEANTAAERKELVANYGAEAARDMSLLRPAINRLGLLVGEVLEKAKEAGVPVESRSNVVNLADHREKEAS
jgi:transcriptional regulator with XRE-family HTH domain